MISRYPARAAGFFYFFRKSSTLCFLFIAKRAGGGGLKISSGVEASSVKLLVRKAGQSEAAVSCDAQLHD